MHELNRLEAARGRVGPVVAIVGGGASGALAAIALLRSSASWRYPVRIIMIDRYGRPGLGQAYSTTHQDHLLNSPADQMSAIAGDPRHLIRWAYANGVDPSGFMRRRDYGRYLRQTLADAAADAAALASFRLVTGEVVAIRPDGRLLTGSGEQFLADLVFLATGSLPSEFPFPVPSSDRVIADPWAPGALDPVTGGGDVVIVGTGLTALDLVLTVTGGNADATVHAVSRHGLLPRPHREGREAEAELRLPEPGAGSAGSGERRLGDLISYVRRALASDGRDWQEVMDALRARVPELWHSMPVSDQQVFLGRFARFWEIHRHRVPKATGDRIAALRRSGRLVVHRGRVSDVKEPGGGLGRHTPALRVRITSEGGAAELSPGWLLNGTGPGQDAARTADPLLRDLFDAGLARPDPLGLGVAATTDGAVLDCSGTPSSRLFTLGPPLRGLWYESTAVTEIREQATGLSEIVAARAAQLLAGSGARR